MSLAYTRWQALLYYSNTDYGSGEYDGTGAVLKSVLDDETVSFVTLNISQSGYQFTPTNELASDISGVPYNKRRGFTDKWTLQLTPYYFDGTEYFTISDSVDIAVALKYRHLWLHFINVPELSCLVDETKAVKVVFETWSESINIASGTRTASLSLQRKFRVD